MSFSFPSNPTLNQQSSQNDRTYIWTGKTWEILTNISVVPTVSGSQYIQVTFSDNNYTIISSGLQPSGNYSSVGHSHSISDISGLQTSLDSKQASGNYALLSGATFTGTVSSPSGSFTNNIAVGSVNITQTTATNMINSANLYLWANFR